MKHPNLTRRMIVRLGKLRGPKLTALVTLMTMAAVSCVSTVAQRMGGSPPQIAGANFVGSAQCAQCHEDVGLHFQDMTHAHLIDTSHSGREQGCESCHGPGSLHVRSGGEPHLIYKGPGACASCHQDISARFSMSYHHPLQEGMMTCTSCHDAHGEKQQTHTSVNASCTSCHQNLRGPHVFEHPPTADSCTTCHDPHGSPVRHMLTMSQPALCLQCHSITNNRHGLTGAASLGQPLPAAVLRNCTSCHSQVHGSSQDQHLRN